MNATTAATDLESIRAKLDALPPERQAEIKAKMRASLAADDEARALRPAVEAADAEVRDSEADRLAAINTWRTRDEALGRYIELANAAGSALRALADHQAVTRQVFAGVVFPHKHPADMVDSSAVADAMAAAVRGDDFSLSAALTKLRGNWLPTALAQDQDAATAKINTANAALAKLKRDVADAEGRASAILAG